MDKQQTFFGYTEEDIELEVIRQQEMNRAQDEYNEYIQNLNEDMVEMEQHRREEYHMLQNLERMHHHTQLGLR